MTEIQVRADHFSHRPDVTRDSLQECLRLMVKNGMKEWRATENPDGYPLGLYVEGWDRKLRWPERQEDFNYPLIWSGLEPK